MGRYFYLTPVLGGPGAPRYPITEVPQLIGRSEKSSIALLEPTVSREHATVQVRENNVYLEDLTSKHGTFVNSKRISSIRLKAGDIVVFGLSLVLRLEEAEEPVAPPPSMNQEGSRPTLSVPNPQTQPSQGAVKKRPPRPTAPVPSQELTKLKEQLVKTRKLAATGALCAADLPAIYGRMSSLAKAFDGKTKLNISKTSEALNQVVNEISRLIAATNLHPPNLMPVLLFDVVNRAVATVSTEVSTRRIDLLVGVPTDFQVLAEPPRLLSAIIEILRNAASASSDGHSVEIGATEDHRMIEMTVADQGNGFPEDQVERLFDPFVTLQQDWSGIGLGLFEAYQIIASFGGQLFLRSKEGSGTTVHIRLRTP
ncbi:MAG: FHA domain-containing protein [Pseudomonadota bacterium]